MSLVFTACIIVMAAFTLLAVWGAALMLWKDALFPEWFDSGASHRCISGVFALAMTAAAIMCTLIVYEGVVSG